MTPLEPGPVEPPVGPAPRELPTMTELDQLSADLDDVDAVLARMDAQSPGSIGDATSSPDDAPIGDPTH